MNTAQKLNFEGQQNIEITNYIEQTVEKQSIIFNDFVSRDFFNFYASWLDFNSGILCGKLR